MAGAANYRSTVAAAVEKGDVSLQKGGRVCHSGCELSLYGGLVAMVVGIAFAAYEAYFNREELRGIPMNETREPAAPAAEAEEARLPTQAEEEIPAPVERPGVTRKLAWYLFGEEEPVAESEGVVVEVEPPAMREQGELEPEC